jgi:hypothetical protein
VLILLRELAKKFVKDGASQFQNFLVNFHKFHPLFSTEYHSSASLSQVLRKMVSDAHWCAQNAENCFGFDFLDRYYKDGYEFLNHIVQVTGDETWVSFMNAETKAQSAGKIVDAHTFTKKAEEI